MNKKPKHNQGINLTEKTNRNKYANLDDIIKMILILFVDKLIQATKQNENDDNDTDTGNENETKQ